MALWVWAMVLGQTVVIDVREADPVARRDLRVQLMEAASRSGLTVARGAQEREALSKIRPWSSRALRDLPECQVSRTPPWVWTLDSEGWVVTGPGPCRWAQGSGRPSVQAWVDLVEDRLADEEEAWAPPPPVGVRLADFGASEADENQDEQDGDDDIEAEMARLRGEVVEESLEHLRRVRPGALKDFAHAWIGTRFRAEDDAESPGVAPSELVQKLYLEIFGFDVGRDLVAMVQDFPEVDIPDGAPKSNLRPGDLLFVVTVGMRPRSVSVYLGRGKVLQSTVTKGVLVRDLPLKQPEHRWLVGRRPLAR